MSIKKRKNEHIRLCLQENVSSYNELSSFENYNFIHNALPEINFSDIDLSTTFLNKKIKAPLLISSMTGGTKEGEKINKNLAAAAQDLGIAMGVGSMKIAFEHPETLKTFQIRKEAPDIPLLSNLGAIQLNNNLKINDCLKLTELINADGLILHLNPLQEAIQPEGETNFKNLLNQISNLKKNSPYPIIVKEVGNGIAYKTAKKLKKIKIDYIDAAGSGGTSWAVIEGLRAQSTIGETFRYWGIPTPLSIMECKKAGAKLIASGGIFSGLDAAKAIALGADMVGIALPLLQPALISKDAVLKILSQFIKELKITMFCSGVKNLKELKKVKLY